MLSRFRGKAKTDVLQTKLQTRQFVIQGKVAYIVYRQTKPSCFSRRMVSHVTFGAQGVGRLHVSCVPMAGA